jgi:hypothetical protein
MKVEPTKLLSILNSNMTDESDFHHEKHRKSPIDLRFQFLMIVTDFQSICTEFLTLSLIERDKQTQHNSQKRFIR